MSCCNGWKMSNSATSERNAPTRNAAPPAAGKYQASLLKPVVVILGARRPKPGRPRPARLFHLLLAGLVQTDKNFVVPIPALIDFQHVFHRTDELGAALRRDAPALFQPRLEFVFLSVWRTVSVLMLSTISHSTSRSANSFSVQPARPSGGSPQARAIRWASP